MSWKAEFYVDREWCENSLRFKTKEEAEAHASDLYMKWTSPTQRRVVESDDPATYTWCFDSNKAQPIKGGTND